MSLREQVLQAAGGPLWAKQRHFTGHLLLGGTLIEPLTRDHSLKEIVAEGDLETRAIRISGFSDVGGAWGFTPRFITMQGDDGAFVGARRAPAPRAFMAEKDAAELVYLCGLSIWNCMTAPVDLLGPGAQTEELGDWSEQGETWRRLKVTAPAGALTFAREVVMYFGADDLLRRTDFDVVCGETLRVADYASAHQSFSGLTLATLHRIVHREGRAGPADPPLLDVELFDATFASAPKPWPA